MMAYISKNPHNAEAQERRRHIDRAEWYSDIAGPYARWARENGIDEREIAAELAKLEELSASHAAAADR